MGRGEQTRQRIVDTALRTVGASGLGRMSFGELAQTVGMSKSGLFAHFGSKEALELGVVQELCRRFEVQVAEPALAEPDPGAALRALLERWMDWIDGDGTPGSCPVVLAMNDAGPSGGPAREHLIGELTRLGIALAERYAAAGGEDATQFLFDLTGVLMAYNVNVRLYADETARVQARRSLDELLRRHLHDISVRAPVSGTATPA